MENISANRIMILSQVLAFIFGFTNGQVDPSCNYYQKMNVKDTYYVYNKEYPNYYYGKQNCRWMAVAPVNYAIQVNCSLNLPETDNCAMDRVLISIEGNSDLQGAQSYCGNRKFVLSSEQNSLAIGLTTQSYTGGGRFLCTMKAVPASPINPNYCDCGWRNTRRIVGGVETMVNEYPMMAGIIDFMNRELYCGATIISNYYALTAAHCVWGKQATSIGLLVGEHNITTGAESAATKLLVISQIIRHPNFDINDANYKNDIAVVKTNEPIQFNMLVGPACLPFKYYDNQFTGKNVTLLGWGTTEYTGPKSNALLATDVNVVDPSTCSGTVSSQMCTYYKGHDACQSDSGGPVIWQEPTTNRVQVIGIISYGIGCASTKPSVNTRVTSYLSWILSVTTDAEYCVK